MGVRGEIFSSRASSGNRTYFFNVKENRAGDLFLNIVESKKRGETAFERHQIVVFQEDFQQFFAEFQKAADFMKGNAGASQGPAAYQHFDSDFDNERPRKKSVVRVRRKPDGDTSQTQIPPTT